MKHLAKNNTYFSQRESYVDREYGIYVMHKRLFN